MPSGTKVVAQPEGRESIDVDMTDRVIRVPAFASFVDLLNIAREVEGQLRSPRLRRLFPPKMGETV
jgi:hypothetical protein